MPINIPDALPATGVLTKENIFVMRSTRASSQDIRPLKVLLLNLMPKKIETEIQLMRLLSNTPLQVNIELLRIDNRPSKNTPEAHLTNFYRTFEQVEHENYDGMLITGAPLGQIDFEEVVFWERLKTIFDWATEHVNAVMYLCWAAHAALHYHYGIERFQRPNKISGVYPHSPCYQHHPLLRGFDQEFWVPHSRYAEVSKQEIAAKSNLQILADSDEAGPYLIASPDGRQLFIMGHPEYDADTLSNEYQRDLAEGIHPSLPENYFRANDPNHTPIMRWASHGNLLFANWLNYFVYQATPYDLSQLQPVQR